MFCLAAARALLATALIGPLLFGSGCRSKNAEDRAPIPIRVNGAHAQVGPILETLNADGVLVALHQATIAARVGGPVTRLLVERGSTVRAGQLVAVLDSKDLEATAIAEQGAFEVAEGTYDQTVGSTLPNELQHALVEQTDARRRVRIAAETLDNVQLMFTRGVTSGKTLAEARLDYSNAQKAQALADGHYADLQRQQNTSAAKIAKGQLEVARGRKLAAEQQLSYTQIRSPIAGTILDRSVAAGDTVAPGAAIAVVADTSKLITKIHIGQEIAQGLHTGEAASITVPGLAVPVPAKVTLVSPALDPGSTTVEVWLEISNASHTLKPGTPVHAQIQLDSVANALLIPSSAVLRPSGEPTYAVFVVGADGIVKRREIQVGIRNGDTTQVVHGLDSNDIVVAEDILLLHDGTKVMLQTAATSH